MTDNPDTSSDFLRDVPRPRQNILGTVVAAITILGIVGVLIALMLPASRTPRSASRRSQCKNNLKQIGLALHNYMDHWGALPPAYTVDANGKPLHSWRTLILPYIDQAPLYRRIDLTKSWDDPANEAAFKTAISVYECPVSDGPSNLTPYLAVVGRKACFHPTQPRRLAEITDGTSETLMVIEVSQARAVPWMAPTDADDTLTQVMGLAPNTKHAHAEGENAVLADGSVRFLAGKLPVATRRALISIDGKDLVGEF